MNKLLLAIILSVAAAGCSTTPTSEKQNQLTTEPAPALKVEPEVKPYRWEYRTFGAEGFSFSKPDGEWLSDFLMKVYEEEGWELVTVLVLDASKGQIVIVVRRHARF